MPGAVLGLHAVLNDVCLGKPESSQLACLPAECKLRQSIVLRSVPAFGQVSAPAVNRDAPLQMLVTNLDYDEHKGRIAIGRVTSGCMQKADAVVIGRPGALQN